MRWRALACLLLGLVLLTGCWDQMDISDRATVLMLSVVWQAPRRLDWTFYFPNPTVTVNSQSQIRPTQQVYAVSVEADTLAGAERDAQRQLDRHLYLGQLQVLFWSSNLPAAAAGEMLDAYNRQGIASKAAYVGLAPARALSRLLQASPQEVVPRLRWQHVFSCAACEPMRLSEPLWHVWDDEHTPGMSPTAPYINARGELGQMAAYGQQGPPVLFSRRQTLGWALLTGRTTREVLAVSRGLYHYTLTAVHGSAATQVAWRGGRLLVDVHITMSGALAEAPYGTAERPAEIRTIEAAAARRLLADCTAAIDRANARHVDPFGYARSLLFSHPQWLKHGSATNWSALPVHAAITVSFHVTTPGVTS